MKFRLVGQIHVYSIENWILVSYQAPKQRARSCQKDMVQCPKTTVVKLKVAAGYCRMVFQFFHGRVGSQYDHRYLSSSIELWEGGLCCVVAHVSVLVELLLAWFWKGSTPERNVLKHGFFTLVSLSLSLHRLRFFTLASPGDLGNTSKLAEVWIFIHFRATKAICAGSNVSQPGLLPGFPHVSPPWAKHATWPPRP